MTHLHLLPGLRVVARGRDHLQVGLLAPHRVVLPRTPATHALLQDLLVGRPHDDDPPADARAALARLEQHGCLAPAGEPVPLRVHVHGELPGPDPATVLAGWDARPGGADDPVLLVGVGDVDRAQADRLVRRGTAHHAVRLVDGAALIGPFVAPGRTACLRCVDAHLADADPDHLAVAGRYARAAGLPRPDGAGDGDAALAVLALAWAVRDLRGHAAGEHPSSWSRTWQVGPGTGAPEARTWQRHPLCGCTWAASWADGDPHAGTMGA